MGLWDSYSEHRGAKLLEKLSCADYLSLLLSMLAKSFWSRTELVKPATSYSIKVLELAPTNPIYVRIRSSILLRYLIPQEQ